MYTFKDIPEDVLKYVILPIKYDNFIKEAYEYKNRYEELMINESRQKERNKQNSEFIKMMTGKYISPDDLFTHYGYYNPLKYNMTIEALKHYENYLML